MQRITRSPAIIAVIAIAVIAQAVLLYVIFANHAATQTTLARAADTATVAASATSVGTATPLPSPTVTPVPTSLTNNMIARVIARTNMYRKQYAPQCVQLTYNAQLTLSAFRHSQDMAIHGFLLHTGSDGSTPPQRMSAAGYHYSTWAENIGWYFSSPEETVDQWFNEKPPDDGHRLNILSCTLHQIGVGYYYTAVGTGSLHSHYYWTQDFGTP
jgi:uncharacterized protein YkwD